jgi:hypothetical protein
VLRLFPRSAAQVCAMAGAGWDRIRPGLLAALLLGAGPAALAQTAGSGGGLAGKLTDLHSTPLDGATVVVRNELTGAEARGVTRKNGSFRFKGLEPGTYTVLAETAAREQGRLEGVVVAAGHEAQVQAAMAFEAARPVEEPAAPAETLIAKAKGGDACGTWRSCATGT